MREDTTRASITQEFEYGCGIACFAFALRISYQQAAQLLGPVQATSIRFWVRDLASHLNQAGLPYKSHHIKQKNKQRMYREGTIVLIRRSSRYPAGHYLIRHNGLWMDPWINLPENTGITNAQSGFRKRLPGAPMYAIVPEKMDRRITPAKPADDTMQL